MEKSAPSVRNFTPPALTRHRAAFSLVEVTVAIGIIGFAFVAIFGLIPVGLNTFRQAMDISVTSQIASRLISDMQQADFNLLIAGAPTGANTSMRLGERYYDEQGTWGNLDNTRIYYVNQRVMPTTDLPGVGDSAKGPDNPNLATVTVQVAYNPGHRDLALETAADKPQNLWTGAYKSAPTNTQAVKIFTYTAQIANNK